MLFNNIEVDSQEGIRRGCILLDYCKEGREGVHGRRRRLVFNIKGSKGKEG